MKTTTSPLAKGFGGLRAFALAALSAFALSGFTAPAQAQTQEELLEGALQPIVDLLGTGGEDLLPDPLPTDPTDLINEITGVLSGDDILGGILDGSIDQNLLDDLAVALEETLNEVRDLVDGGELTDPTVLDPLREFLLSVLDLLLGIGGEDVLDFLEIDELLPAEDLLDLGILDLDILDSLLNDLLSDGGLIASVSDLLDGLLGGILGSLIDILPDNITDLITVVIDLINPVLEPDDPPAPKPRPTPTNTRGIDLIVGKRGGIGKGHNKYGTYKGQRFTGKHRMRKKFRAPSRFAFTVQNDGRRAERPALNGSPNKGYLRIQYFVGGKNRSGAIRTGRYNAKTLRPGASYVVKVKTRARAKLRKNNGEIRKKKAIIRLKARGQQGSDRAMLRVRTGLK